MANFTEFNKQAGQYALFRPSYPPELYHYLRGLCLVGEAAYDVGTGNGQCAVDLAKHFQKVYASDLSEEQIANALPHERVQYFVAPAHKSPLAAGSVDLVTVATAVHWFDFDLFYAEVKRLLKSEGLLAIWAYGWHECENPEITKIFNEIGQGLLAPFWSDPPKLIWQGYKTIPFPFQEIPSPSFKMTVEWTLAQLVGYLSTWSASQKFTDRYGYHPVRDSYEDLLKIWGDPEKKLKFTSPLHLRVGKKVS